MEFRFFRKLRIVTFIGNNSKILGSIKGQKLLFREEFLRFSRRIPQHRVKVINKELSLIRMHKRVLTQYVRR
jgi:hypothetical protein